MNREEEKKKKRGTGLRRSTIQNRGRFESILIGRVLLHTKILTLVTT